MRFKTIITLLFTLLSVGVEAKTFKTIKNPVAMAHNIPGGELKAREVVLAADLIRSISAKYPGRYLMIDFWGMGCGPCRSAIQSSKDLRTKIAKRDDIKLVFIAEERIAGGSDAYKNYVAEWLADEETICITNAEFARMQELFQFNGIPHYETFTPDCRRVRDDLRFNGYYNFDMYLKELKEKLK